MPYRIVQGKKRPTYYLNGKRVSLKRLLERYPDALDNFIPQLALGTSSGWPMVSDALAVHPKQVDQANARAKRHGIQVQYRPDGRPVIPDASNRYKLLKLEAFHDNNGGYRG